MEIGARVMVSTDQFDGVGSIMYIAAASDIYPVQVELDDADDDGHKVKRFAFDEVKEQEQEQQEKPQRWLARVSWPRSGYIVGREFIIGPAKDEPYFNVYLKDKPNNGPVGSYIKDFFEKIEPFKEPQTAQIKPVEVKRINTLTITKTIEDEPKIKQKEASKEKGIKHEQLSLFDF